MSLPESAGEALAREDVFRELYGLPPRTFAEPIARYEAHWDTAGAQIAVRLEFERPLQRPRDPENDNVSVGYAHGFGFYFGIVRLSDDEIAARTLLREKTRQSPSSGSEDVNEETALRGGSIGDKDDMLGASGRAEKQKLGDAPRESIEHDDNAAGVPLVDASPVDVMQSSAAVVSPSAAPLREAVRNVDENAANCNEAPLSDGAPVLDDLLILDDAVRTNENTTVVGEVDDDE